MSSRTGRVVFRGNRQSGGVAGIQAGVLWGADVVGWGQSVRSGIEKAGLIGVRLGGCVGQRAERVGAGDGAHGEVQRGVGDGAGREAEIILDRGAPGVAAGRVAAAEIDEPQGPVHFGAGADVAGGAAVGATHAEARCRHVRGGGHGL